MKKIFIFLIIILMMGFIGCRKQKLKIIGEDFVTTGKTMILEHNFPKESITKWSSSDETIAIIENGTLYAISEGQVIITLQIDEYIAYKKIDVVFPIFNIEIKCESTIYIGESEKIEVVIPDEYKDKYSGVLSVSDESLAIINSNSYIKGLSEGIVTIYYKIAGQIFETTVKVEYKKSTSVKFDKVSSNVFIGTLLQLNVVFAPENTKSKYYFVSSDKEIAYVDENDCLVGLKPGKVIISVYSEGEVPGEYLKSASKSFTVYGSFPENIIVDSIEDLKVGDSVVLSAEVIGDENVSKELTWISSDPTIAAVYDGILVCLKSGKVTITAKSLINNCCGSADVVINYKDQNSYSQENIDKVNYMISKMSLSQKIGQMFVVGFNGTSYSNELKNVISNYNFGNIIYMGGNVTSPSTLRDLSINIQNKMIEENGVPAFISIDQEGGRVVRLKNGGTHFISNMGIGATNNFNNAYLEGKAVGNELSYYGINTNFAPVCDVNNNRDNPVIGMRSYSENAVLVSQFSENMYKGLEESGIMATVKHFPGHGNTNVDSHYGLPVINSKIEDLFQTELVPFINAINNDIDCIMTAHIIFSAIDKDYPSTLSSKVITDFLRGQLGYDGLIVTDGMEMQAIASNYGNYGETAVRAVNAGVDLLLYTTNTNPRMAHNALMEAVNSGEISIQRIEESVRRILLTKLKYGILENYKFNDINIDELLAKNANLNQKFANESVTLYNGNYEMFDKNKKTIVISPICSEDLGEGLTDNSPANYLCMYLRNNGFISVDYYIIEEKNDSSLNNKLKLYDQIIYLEDKPNIKDGYLTHINKIANSGKNYLLVGYEYPFYDLYSSDESSAYTNYEFNNYVFIYGCQKENFIALGKYICGEIQANGIFPN